MRLAQRRGRRFGEAEGAHLAGRDQLADGAGDILDRHVRVDAVLVEEVDVIGAEPLQRGVGDLLDVRGAAVEPGDAAHAGALLRDLETELRGDRHLVAHVLQRLADDDLVLVGPVDFGGVEERDADVDGLVQRGDGIRFRRAAIVDAGESHAAEPDGRDLQLAEMTRSHE